MYAGPLSSDYSAAARPSGLRRDRILNYIWIGQKYWHGEREAAEQEGILCDMPLHYLDRAFENAQAYPDTEVKLWLDLRALDPQTRFFIGSHISFFAPPNVVVHDLPSLLTYQCHDFFAPDSTRDIWMRSDVARLLVAEHCFSDKNVETVFYSDFDVPYVALDGAETTAALDQYHMSFGFASNGRMENSYFAFSREGMEFLSYLYHFTMFEIRGGRATNGYKPMHLVMNDRFEENIEKLRATAIVPISRTPLAPSRLYTDLGLVYCPKHHRRLL